MARKRRTEKKFWRDLFNELHEHRSSFIAFSILRLLTIIILVRQIMIQNYESAFFCLLTILLLYIPSWLQVQLHFELPPALEITVLCLIFSAAVLGEVNAFYVVVPGWDTILHTINGFLAAAVGFSLVMFLNGHKKFLFELSPFFLALVSFCFSMTIGILWEFFEFGMDRFFGMDMQKDTIVHMINTVKLDETMTNAGIAVRQI